MEIDLKVLTGVVFDLKDSRPSGVTIKVDQGTTTLLQKGAEELELVRLILDPGLPISGIKAWIIAKIGEIGPKSVEVRCLKRSPEEIKEFKKDIEQQTGMTVPVFYGPKKMTD